VTPSVTSDGGPDRVFAAAVPVRGKTVKASTVRRAAHAVYTLHVERSPVYRRDASYLREV
jgi:hypothetical protein